MIMRLLKGRVYDKAEKDLSPRGDAFNGVATFTFMTNLMIIMTNLMIIMRPAKVPLLSTNLALPRLAASCLFF